MAALALAALVGCDRESVRDAGASACEQFSGGQVGSVRATLGPRTYATTCVRVQDDGGEGRVAVFSTDDAEAADPAFLTLRLPAAAGTFEIGRHAEVEYAAGAGGTPETRDYRSVSGEVVVTAFEERRVEGIFDAVARNEAGQEVRLVGGRFSVTR